MADIPSLVEFAQRKRKCKLCDLPPQLRQEIERAIRAGVGHATVERWLFAYHPDHLASDSSIRAHMRHADP